MSNTYQIYLISDSTGETLDRIFLALKAQFKNIKYEVKPYSFTRTENQILKILEDAKKKENSVIFMEDDYEKNYAGFDPNSPESVMSILLSQEEYLDQSIQLASLIQKSFSGKLLSNTTFDLKEIKNLKRK
mgnify:CR=1 FL=1